MAIGDEANGPTRSSTTTSAPPSGGAPAPGPSTTGGGSHSATRTRTAAGGVAGLAIAMLVLGLVLGAAGKALIDGSDNGGGGKVLAGNIDANSYQAVILANDKVYFGRLSEVNDTFFRLDRAFFLRETRENDNAEPVRTLLPVNRELHAPQNSMLIRRDEVVLIEDLAKDSPVLTEIKRQTGSTKK